jgi:diacylglycerol kinase (ATP)
MHRAPAGRGRCCAEMHVLIIANPIAGTGQTERLVREFGDLLTNRGHDVEICLTARAGEAEETARSLGNGLDRLVIAGGDGTMNEVLNGLADPSRIPILHLPTGTANQLALTLQLPDNQEQLTTCLEQGLTKRIDMGVAGGRRFLLLVSAGFDAKVAEQVRKSRGNTLGYSGYMLPILKTAAAHRPARLRIVVDDREEITGYNVMVLKVRRYGGIFVFADDASLDSGNFEICVFREGTIGWLCLYALAGLTRKASEFPGLICTTGRKVRIESDDPVPVEIDGDHCGVTPIDIELQPAVVPVIVPCS